MSETSNKPTVTAVDPTKLGSGQFGASFSEKVNIDPTANAFAQRSPLDDGEYAFLLEATDEPGKNIIETVTFPPRDGKPALSFFRINVKLTAVATADGRDFAAATKGRSGLVHYDDFSTQVRDVNGAQTSQVATILTMLGLKYSPNASQEELAGLFVNNVLKSKQFQIVRTTYWRAGWDGQTKKWLQQGQKNFSQMANGKGFDPIYKANGVEYAAKAGLGVKIKAVTKR